MSEHYCTYSHCRHYEPYDSFFGARGYCWFWEEIITDRCPCGTADEYKKQLKHNNEQM